MSRRLQAYERPQRGDEAIPEGAAVPVRRVVDGWPLSPITYERDGERRMCLLSTWVTWCRHHAAEYRRGGVDLLRPSGLDD